jgi:hypothetical protein
MTDTSTWAAGSPTTGTKLTQRPEKRVDVLAQAVELREKILKVPYKLTSAAYDGKPSP